MQKKPFKSIEEQLSILKSRGLIIQDDESVRNKLLHNNYYTIVNGYKYPFLKNLGESETFKDGATFEEIFALYEFDCSLRALLLKYILKVEHQLKSVISHHFASSRKNMIYPDYLDVEQFGINENGSVSIKKQRAYDDFMENVQAELKHQLANHNPMLEHYKTKYGDIPPWILVSTLSFGMIRAFYYCLNNREQNEIARKFNLFPNSLNDYLAALNIYRNACAHDERIYNLPLRNRISRRDVYGCKKEYGNIYIVFLALKDMLDSETFMSFYSEFDNHLNVLTQNLKTISVSEIFRAMGMPESADVRKADLGALERGNALSELEFKEVLCRYIIPMLPMPTLLKSVDDKDQNKHNLRCKFVELIDNKLYFSQSKVGEFSYYVFLNNTIISAEQINNIQQHLSTLIDYIHVFWNLSNLSACGRDKVEIAFPVLCEQAYELTICNLMCKINSADLYRKYSKIYKDYQQKVGKLSDEELLELKSLLINSRKNYYDSIDNESLVQRTLYAILMQLETWSIKTYEGQRKTFGIILCKNELSNNYNSFDYIEFLKKDYSATINDGFYSAVELYSDGIYKSHVQINNNVNLFLPSIAYPLTGFANLCDENKIGILLTESGDILIINDKKLCYTKHNGRWLRCDSTNVITRIKEELELEYINHAELIYQTIVDISYSRGGACIGVVNSDILPPELSNMIEAGLLCKNHTDEKLIALKNLITKNNRQNTFYSLDRHLRRELLELDGAMVFSKNGLIHAIGTIIKLDGSGSTGGGRTAAAIQLSQYGLSIKVSQDGYVQLFKNGVSILEIMT